MVFGDPHQSKAAYRFLSNREVSPEGVLSGHVARTAQRCREHPAVLLIQDVVSFTFSRSSPRRDLGPLHPSLPVQGLKGQTVLAVAADTHEVLGSLHQKLWARSKQKKQDQMSSKRRKKRVCESDNWLECAERADAVLRQGSHPTLPRCIDVFDREGDNYLALVGLRDIGHSFVVRASQNRALAQKQEKTQYLVEAARNAQVRGAATVQVPKKKGEPAREARVTLRSATLNLKQPANLVGSGIDTTPSFAINVVVVREERPPAECTGLEWILLTLEPIKSLEDVQNVVRIYEARWLIEELHMGMKTGCACEERQLESALGLMNFIAFATVISWRLLALRDFARKNRGKKARKILPDSTLKALEALQPKFNRDDSAEEAMRNIGMLGGFMGRKSDGDPGWRTLWRGFQRVLEAERTLTAAGQFEPG